MPTSSFKEQSKPKIDILGLNKQDTNLSGLLIFDILPLMLSNV